MKTLNGKAALDFNKEHGFGGIEYIESFQGRGAQWCSKIYCAIGLANFNTIRMSRIGAQPIVVLAGVRIQIADNAITVTGPKGTLSRTLAREIGIAAQGDMLVLSPRIDSRRTSALWGLTRSLVANMVAGVASGFEKKLEYEGIGYRAAVEGTTLVMQLGFSHPVRFDAPPGIALKVERNVITVSGADREAVGSAAAAIRAYKKPEPYKGKGIRYQGEIVRRKAGKKGATTA